MKMHTYLFPGTIIIHVLWLW